VQGRHPLPLGVKRGLRHPGERRHGGLVHPRLGRRHHEGTLRRVADDPVPLRLLAEFGVVAEEPRPQGREQHRFFLDPDLAPVAPEPSHRLEPLAGDSECLPPCPDLRHRHLVLGEGPCFICADDGRRAEGLHRGQAPHERVATQHLPRPQGEAHRDDRRQPLGDSGHRQTHRDHEEPDQGVLGVVKVDTQALRPQKVDFGLAEDGQDKHQHADHEDGRPEDLPEHFELFLKRGLLDRLLDHLRDRAELGVGAGPHHDPPAPTVDDGRPHERGIGALGDRRLCGEDGFRLLLHRDGLPGEGRFIHPHLRCFDQAQVSGHDRARLEEDHIAGDEIPRSNGRPLPVAHDLGLGRRHLLEALQRLLGPALLRRTHERVEDNDREDDDRIKPSQWLRLNHLHDQRNERCCKEDPHHESTQLRNEPLPKRRGWGLREGVRAVAGEPLPRLRRGEPRPGVHLEGRGDVTSRESVPRLLRFHRHLLPTTPRGGGSPVRTPRRRATSR